MRTSRRSVLRIQKHWTLSTLESRAQEQENEEIIKGPIRETICPRKIAGQEWGTAPSFFRWCICFPQIVRLMRITPIWLFHNENWNIKKQRKNHTITTIQWFDFVALLNGWFSSGFISTLRTLIVHLAFDGLKLGDAPSNTTKIAHSQPRVGPQASLYWRIEVHDLLTRRMRVNPRLCTEWLVEDNYHGRQGVIDGLFAVESSSHHSKRNRKHRERKKIRAKTKGIKAKTARLWIIMTKYVSRFKIGRKKSKTQGKAL